MIKFEAKNFKPGNYAIEASAGTGKTYNIIEIVKKLVNKLGYNLSEILIVTYTEKATGELKERIRKELAGHDTSNANIYTIHSFCQHSIAEFGISADLPLNMNVINDDALEEFVKRYTRQSKVFTETLPLFASKFNFEVFVEFMILAIKKYYLNSKYEEDKSKYSL